MRILPKIDMGEATRLTREGRLREALAVLRAGSSARLPGAPTRGMTPEALRGLADRLGSALPPGGLGRGLGANAARPPVRVPVPQGARFEERSFTCAEGSRAYKLYVPSGYRGEAVPLVVMLHGCTQSPDDFAAGTRMNELGEESTFLVAYPAQSQSANASRCWNWFNAGDQGRDRGEPAIIAGLTREVMREFAVDQRRVFVAGLSAGGAQAAIMGVAYPDLFAAIGVHSGLACGAAADMPSAFAAMKRGGGAGRRSRSAASIRAIVFHGDRDATVAPVNGHEVMAQAAGGADLETSTTLGGTAAGVSYTRTLHRDREGSTVLEHWVLHGAGHAWSGGSPAGSYTDPDGPDASREMMRFFLQAEG